MQNINVRLHALLLMLVLLVVSSCSIFAQETLLVGQVLDAGNQQPIAGVNVFFKNTSIGMKSDAEGYFMLRTKGNETTVVFSCIGYQKQELQLKPGQSVGTQIELKESVSELTELLVLPGINPALNLMKRVRAARVRNNVRGSSAYSARLNEQKVVMLSKISSGRISDRLFSQFSESIINPDDSSKMIPLLMSENDFSVQNRRITVETKKIFKSDVRFEHFLQQLTGEITADLNFYQHTVTIFGKEFISPLSDVANSFYKFYLADSIASVGGLIYKVNFRSSNNKNLAFNGTLYIDSATMALQSVIASVPASANINFVNKLNFSQSFSRTDKGVWLPDSSQLTVSMQLQLPGDTVNKQWPGIFVSSKLSTREVLNKESLTQFAGTSYKAEDLNSKLSLMNQTPVMRAARWVADVLLTGYARVGKIDVGKVVDIARITDLEGLKLAVPFRTNERLWPGVSVGGMLGYAFKNQSVPYSAFASVKLPFGSRNIITATHTEDFRQIDYDYYDFQYRENPLVSGDEDVVSTLFAIRSSAWVSKRKESSLTFTSDVSKGVELSTSFHANTIFSSPTLPFASNALVLDSYAYKNLSVTGRFSFGQRYYNDHLRRIYADTYNPVIYATVVGGEYSCGDKNGKYAKFMANISQTIPFGFGSWSYIADAGILAGKVPYHLLFIPQGTESNGYSRAKFSALPYLAFASDAYVALHNEVNLNGVVLNYIPLIKYLNLREMITFKFLYGTRRPTHGTILDIPSSLFVPGSCYAELGLGVSNVLRLFTLQAVWQIEDDYRLHVSHWRLKAGISVKF